MGKWIPTFAKSYAIYKDYDINSITITFSPFSAEKLGGDTKPISQLAHDLAISDVCQQMRDKPLEERITTEVKGYSIKGDSGGRGVPMKEALKSLDDVTCEEWDEGRMDNIGRNGNDGLAYTAKQMELKKTLLEAAEKLMKAARLIA